MEKLTISIKTAFMVVVIVFLTAGNGWAVASFAKKYGMGCKSCHTFGSELNALGLTFKKNGYTFGEKNAEQKPKQAVQRDEKSTVSELTDKIPDKPGSVNSGITDDPAAVAAVPYEEQPLTETKVYSWKSDDGTLHFSDTPYVKPPGTNKPVPDKAVKKNWRSGSRPLSAPIPKRLQKVIVKTAAPKPAKAALSKPAFHEPQEAIQVEIKPGGKSISFEECMEQILAAHPLPKNSEAVMEQFKEAEDICASYEKKP